MLNRKFTLRETLLLLVCTVLFLGLFYYLVVVKPVYAEISRTTAEEIPLRDELDLEILKATRKKKMLNEMAENPPAARGEICVYNNLKAEMNELYQTLAQTQNYNLSFSEAMLSGNIVRRDVTVNFETASNEQACQVIRQLEDSQYRCLIKDVDLAGQNSRNASAEEPKINTTLKITYYETTTGAQDLKGLVMEETKAAAPNPDEEIQ